MRPSVLPLCLTGPLAQADPPRPPGPVPAGRWTVAFSNGVVERVEVKADGTASVTEPSRASAATVTRVQGTILFVCDDGRVERWTSVGGRMVVEHWAGDYPHGAPVRGIADAAVLDRASPRRWDSRPGPDVQLRGCFPLGAGQSC